MDLNHQVNNPKILSDIKNFALEVALPETLPSSTPVIPEAAQSDVLSSSDLLMFKNEIRTQLSRLEDKLADIKSGEWLLGNDHFRKMAGSIALLDKVPLKFDFLFSQYCLDC